MDEDLIAAVELDPEGRLHVTPAIRSFPYAYREGMEVSWDPLRRSLHSAPPRAWSYGRWFQQILALAEAQGTRLVLHRGTAWFNVPEAIRVELLQAAGQDA
ncbi:hypothetical protein ACFFGH_33945 [Lysobacter korlensis]|uniref:Integron Cassette Protein Hfx-Cass5 domain-containing protein n=1 Tax=Lysobacter korlensis TaxID=553636 RepID=A0ABV6S0V8_9GAMM